MGHVWLKPVEVVQHQGDCEGIGPRRSRVLALLQALPQLACVVIPHGSNGQVALLVVCDESQEKVSLGHATWAKQKHRQPAVACLRQLQTNPENLMEVAGC